MSLSNHIVDQINNLIEKSFDLHLKDADQAMLLCQKALSLSEELVNDGFQYEQGQANIDASLSWLYQNASEYALALQHGLAAITQLEKLPDKRYLPHVAGALGTAYFRTGDHEQSLSYFLKHLEISEQLNDRWNIARAHLGIGLVISRTRDYELALKHDNLSLEMYRELGDLERQGTIINNMCLNALEQELFAEALQIGLSGLDLDLTEDDHRETLIFLHSKIHRAYLGLDQIDKAKSHLDYATQLVANNPNRFMQSLITRECAQFAKYLGNFDEAIAGFKKLAELTEEPFIPAFQEVAHLGLYQLYKQIGDVELALFHHEKYHSVVVRELQNQSVVRLNLLTTKHQIEKEHKEAELLREQSGKLQQLVEEQTVRLSQSLTREQQLAKNLRFALDRAEKLNQLKSRVIEVVSHEFRTPLAAINNSATLIGLYLSKLSDTQREKHVSIIQQGIVNLTSLIRDVENVGESKAGSLSPNFESMSLSALCSSLDTNLIQLERDLEFSGRVVTRCRSMLDDAMILTDYDTVEKLTELLLSNALKFSEAQVQVDFSIVDDKLVVSFSDQGIGIPNGEFERVFELFERGSNAGSIRGLGVGLYLAKQLADIIDAKISIESAGLNQGAQFILEIPLSETQALQDESVRLSI